MSQTSTTRPSSLNELLPPTSDDRTHIANVENQHKQTQQADEATLISARLEVTQTPSALSPADANKSTQGPNADQPLTIGSILKDRFVLEEIIGAGGMGVVFKALDLRAREAHDRDPFVAIKVLNRELAGDPQFLIALQRETKRAKLLSHPNIINVYDFDRDGPHVFMSMEYLRGKPLSAYIKALPKGRMPLKKAWPIINSMGSALAYAHRKKIVHSDFKPGNVFIDENDDIKVLDFGIACVIGPKETGEREATLYDSRSLGAMSPAYASLEMLEGGEPDTRDDIYALACVSYEILAGSHPFARLTAQQALDLNLQPKRIHGISGRQWRALLHALALKREDRTRNVEEFLQEFQPRSTAGLWALAPGGIVIFLIGITYWLFYRSPPSAPPAAPAAIEKVYADKPLPRPDAQTIGKLSVQQIESTEGRNISQSADGILSLWTSSSTYKIGDELKVNFSVVKPSYLKVLHVGASGEITTLFPNEYQPDRKFMPGVEYQIPPKDAPFSLTVLGPAGFDTVTLVASDKPIPANLRILDPSGILTEEARHTVMSWAQLRYAVRK